MNATAIIEITPTTVRAERLAAFARKIAHHTRLVTDARDALRLAIDPRRELTCTVLFEIAHLTARIERSGRLIDSARLEAAEWADAH